MGGWGDCLACSTWSSTICAQAAKTGSGHREESDYPADHAKTALMPYRAGRQH